MGLTFFKRKRGGKTGALNLSKSGVSASKRVGGVSVSSRGRGWAKPGTGLGFWFKI